MKAQTPNLYTAICHAEPEVGMLAIALCLELPQDGKVPEWVQILPVGEVKGRDGREWTNPDPEAVIRRTLENQRDVVLDWEHATELKAPNGEKAPAAGWLKGANAYKVENGFIWGKFDYTPDGLKSVANSECRYLSPVFRYTADGVIWDITSVALTNRNNLYTKALNHQNPTKPQEKAMELAELLALLGLPATTTLEAARNHIQKMQSDLQTALNHAQQPSLDKFVPRGDYDAMKQRAMNAEQSLVDRNKADHKKAAEAAVDGAIKAGKIAPASKDYYLQTACNSEEGLKAFNTFIETAPVITTPSSLDGKQVPSEHLTAMNAEQKKMVAAFGNTEEDMKKYADR